MIVCTQQVKGGASQGHCWPGTINIRLNLNGSEFILIHCLSLWQNRLVSHSVETEIVNVNKVLMEKCMFDGASSKSRKIVRCCMHVYVSLC